MKIWVKGMRMSAAWAILGAILACGGGNGGSSSDPEPEVQGAGLQLATGFMPDPRTETGTAGGPTQASNLDPQCRGWIPAEPQHTVTLTTNFTNLRVVVGGEGDTTMVIRKPDGTYQCDDDGGEGFNPLIEGPFNTGTYDIFIGTYSETSPPAAYTIGYSELSHVSAATLQGGNTM